MKLTIYDLVNHIIHNWHEMVFLHAVQDESDKGFHEHIICKWNDDFYNEHKQDLYKIEVSFFTITPTEIRVFLKEDFNV